MSNNNQYKYTRLAFTQCLETVPSFWYPVLGLFHRGNDNVWTGAREPDGHKNDPTLVRFTDGSTHDYIPPDLDLNDGSSCIRLFSGEIGDYSCGKKWSFICMSDPIQPQGNQWRICIVKFSDPPSARPEFHSIVFAQMWPNNRLAHFIRCWRPLC